MVKWHLLQLKKRLGMKIEFIDFNWYQYHYWFCLLIQFFTDSLLDVMPPQSLQNNKLTLLWEAFSSNNNKDFEGVIVVSRHKWLKAWLNFTKKFMLTVQHLQHCGFMQEWNTTFVKCTRLKYLMPCAFSFIIAHFPLKHFLFTFIANKWTVCMIPSLT